MARPRAPERARTVALPRGETIAFAAILLLAAGLRLWDLGARAFHYDESLHATFSWYFASGRGFVHDPLMHGPLQFDIDAAFFRVFGATNFSARLPHALFGTALAALPWLLRRQIGMRAVLVASLLLAVSPTLVYYSRFDREDIFAATWTLGIVICAWRYLDSARERIEPDVRWLYALALLLGLDFATKETAFITAAALLLFFDVMLAASLASREGRPPSVQRIALLAPVAWLAAAAWPVARRRFPGRERLPPAGDLVVVIGTLVVPQLGALTQLLPVVGHASHAFAPDPVRHERVLFLLACSVYCGLNWRPKQYLIVIAAFYVPYVLAFTTFLTHPAGIWSGAWGSLDYWLGQQDSRRGDQPGYYYLLLVPLYEFLPLLITLAGGWWLVVRSTPWRRWLAFWPLAMLIALSLAGEKMPWLAVHIAVPLCLVAGVVVGRLLDVLAPDRRTALRLAAVGAVSALATLLVVEGGLPLAVAGLLIFAGAGLAIAWTGRRESWRVAAFSVAAVAFAGLLALTVRASYIASFPNGDTPVELLEYTQTSPEVNSILDRIKSEADSRGRGLDQPIIIDGVLDNDRPWSWYLRDYANVKYVNFRTLEPANGSVVLFKPPPGTVVIADATSVGGIDTTGFERVPFRVRWWFDEEGYRGLTVVRVASLITSPSRLEDLGHFFLYRRSSEKTGAINVVALFPEAP